MVDIFTKTDLLGYYLKSYAGKNKVGDFMTFVFTDTTAPLYIVRKMVENNISRIIVKNKTRAGLLLSYTL